MVIMIKMRKRKSFNLFLFLSVNYRSPLLFFREADKSSGTTHERVFFHLILALVRDNTDIACAAYFMVSRRHHVMVQ
jgi:hypothetical protein